MTDSDGAPEVKSDADSEFELRTSDHFVRMIDVVFALVIGQGLLLFRDVLTDPFAEDHIVAGMALATIFYTVVRSFVGWHITMERNPYLIVRSGRYEKTERYRLYADLGVVVLYAYLVFAAVELIEDPEADLGPFLLGFPLVFLLYLVSGQLRLRSHGEKASKPRALIISAVGFLLIYLAYVIPRATGADFFFDEACTVNGVFVGLVFLAMLGYRWRWEFRRLRFLQQ